MQDLGVFSISLTVKDLSVSSEFYQKLGFKVIGGALDHHYQVLALGDTRIGLFEGMFDKNILTFNPVDARAIQKKLKEQGIELVREIEDEDGDGPTSLTLTDPDGNPILIDQHDEETMRVINTRGRIGWVDLTTGDADEVRDFYQAVVGWNSIAISMGDYDDYCMSRADDTVVAGVCHKKGSNESMPDGWMIYISVADFDQSLQAAEENGGKVVVATRGKAPNRFAVIEDPKGSRFAISEQ